MVDKSINLALYVYVAIYVDIENIFTVNICGSCNLFFDIPYEIEIKDMYMNEIWYEYIKYLKQENKDRL